MKIEKKSMIMVVLGIFAAIGIAAVPGTATAIDNAETIVKSACLNDTQISLSDAKKTACTAAYKAIYEAASSLQASCKTTCKTSLKKETDRDRCESVCEKLFK